MKILFYDTKSYDREFFEKLLPSYPGIEIKFIEANIHEETAALAHGYDAICAFVNADLGAPVIEELHRQGVKLILMRCAGYNNVDLETTATSAAAVLSNSGIGMGLFGETGNLSMFCPASQIFMSFLMILGRLELFTILLLFFPSFWNPTRQKN